MSTPLSDNIELFHVFSKTPVSHKAGLANAVNRSGHTVSKEDVLCSDLPFFSRLQFKRIQDAHAALRNARLNDIVQEASTNNLYKRNASPLDDEHTNWEYYWDPFTLNDGDTLYNSAGEGVLVYHKAKALDPVTLANNSNTGSEGSVAGNYFAGRLKLHNAETDKDYFLPFFVDVNDKVVDGYPSLGFMPQVESESLNLSPAENGSKFWVNTYSGMVLFESECKVDQVNISCFEYIGEKLDKTVEIAAEAYNSVFSFGPRIETLETNLGSPFTEGPRVSAFKHLQTLYTFGPENLGNPDDPAGNTSAFSRIKAIEDAEVKVDSTTSQKKNELVNKYLGLFSGQQLYKLYELVSHITITEQ